MRISSKDSCTYEHWPFLGAEGGFLLELDGGRSSPEVRGNLSGSDSARVRIGYRTVEDDVHFLVVTVERGGTEESPADSVDEIITMEDARYIKSRFSYIGYIII